MARRHARATFTPLMLALLAIAAAAQAPRVTSATPRTVQLRTGGPAVDLFLRGRSLGSITGALVMLNNQEIDGLTIEVVRVTTTSAAFRIEADDSAPPGSARLFLITKAGQFAAPVTVRITAPPPRLATIELTDSQVTGGESLSLRVVLDRPAVGRGTRVALSVDNASLVRVPRLVVVPAGEDEVEITLATAKVEESTSAEIAARLGRDRFTADVTLLSGVAPPRLSEMVLEPSDVMGGEPLVLTVVLSQPAPAGGAVVQLTVDNPRLIRMARVVVVREGDTEVEVPLRTSAVRRPSQGVVTAVFDGNEMTATLSLRPRPPAPRLVRFEVASTEVIGGETLEVTVGLDRPADVRAARIGLGFTPAGLVSGQRIVMIPVGEDEVTVTLSTTAVSEDTQAQVLAIMARVRLTADVTLLAPDVTFTPVEMTTGGLVYTGNRFSPIAMTTGGLVYTGNRFSPVVMTTGGLVYTGNRFSPVAMTTDGLIYTGNRSGGTFTPVAFTADGLAMTGLRFNPVAFTADGLAMTGLRFSPVAFTADGLAMTGLRFSPVAFTADGLTMTGIRSSFRPVELTTGAISMSGLRFNPVELTTETIRMTGNR